MGKRGFLPKNKAERVLTGQLPVTQANLGPAYGMPVRLDPPDRLDVEQKSVWVRTVELLSGCGMIGSADVVVLEAYSRSYVNWQKAERDWEKHLKDSGSYMKATIMKGAQSAAIIHPFVKAVRDARQEVVQLAVQLGMSPMARLRMEQGTVGVVEKKTNIFKALKDIGKNGQ